MKKLSILFFINFIFCSLVHGGIMSSSWSNDTIIMGWSCVDMVWNHPYPYGLDVNDVTINPSKFTSDDPFPIRRTYGNNILFDFQCEDNIDFIGRVIFSSVINNLNPDENAWAIAQLIVNRMNNEKKTAMEVVKGFNRNKYFFCPSCNNNYDSAYLFIECCYLGKCIITGNKIPLTREDGKELYPYINQRNKFLIIDPKSNNKNNDIDDGITIGNIMYYNNI